MRKYIVLSLWVMFNYSAAFCQCKFDYNWLGGTGSVMPTPGYDNYIMNFNDGELSITELYFDMDIYVCNASMSDPEGTLIFYSNGCRINDASHKVMQDGDMINQGQVWEQDCTDSIYASYTSPKGMITLPRPGYPNEYWLFHNSASFGNSPFLIFSDKLLYTVIDMSLNNGLGAVTEKNQVILKDTLAAGTLSAVKHANGEDWWIIIAKEPFVDSVYFKVLFTEAGIVQVDTQYIGHKTTEQASAAGQAQFSPDGSMYGWYSYPTQLALFDFDRSTGQLSNYQQIHVDTNANHWGSLCFSPNSRYLYVGTQINLWQFDTWAAVIEASKVHIDSFDGYKSGVLPANFGYMQIGPDCNIYMVTVSGTDVMHIIHNPDSYGSDCEFRQHDLKLPVFNNPLSQPNFPNYRLDTPYPLCDSSIVYVPTGQVVRPVGGVRVYPNPASEFLVVAFGKPLPEGSIVLFDLMGRQVLRESFTDESQQLVLDVSRLPSGIYLLWVSGGSSQLTRTISISK